MLPYMLKPWLHVNISSVFNDMHRYIIFCCILWFFEVKFSVDYKLRHTFDSYADGGRVLVDAVRRDAPIQPAVTDRRVFDHEQTPAVWHPHPTFLGDRKLVAIPRDQKVRRAAGVGGSVAAESNIIGRRRHDDARGRWHNSRAIWNTPISSRMWQYFSTKFQSQFDSLYLSLT